MMWEIAKKELRLNFLNLRIPLILIISVFFAAISTVISSNHFEERVKDYHTRYAYHKFSESSVYADRSPETLSIFCSGVFFKTPLSIESPKVPFFGNEKTVIEHPTDNILFAQFQYPNVCLVIAIVAGLGAILFGFDSICGEKQQGTLKLALSNNIPRYKLLLGKFLGNALGLLATVLVVWLVSLIIATQNPSAQLKASNFALLGLACLTSFTYVIVMLIVAIFISSMSRSAWGALVVCVTFWMVSCLFAPPLGPMTAKMINKVPAYQRLVLSKHSLLSQEADRVLAQNNKKVKKTENQEQIHQIMMETIKTDAVKWSNLNKILISDYEYNVGKQIDLSRLICSISPPLAFQFALSELCGTSITTQRYFEQQAMDWAQALTESNLKKYSKDLFRVLSLEMAQPVIKDFSIGERLKHCLGYVAYMVILAIVCFALTFVRFVRYDVR